MTSPSQFAWQYISHEIGVSDWPPPEPKRGEQYGHDDLCWLCGGATDGVGWPQKTAFAPTFTNFNLAVVPSSQSVCQACVAMAQNETWNLYLAAHPELGLKSGKRMGWRYYSHLFTPNSHESPSRERWRELLLDPPEPPFIMCMSESGQKQLIFRCQIAHSRDEFPVQVEEDSIVLNRSAFSGVLEAFERLYHLGMSKDSIVTGHYLTHIIRKTGMHDWRIAEEQFRPYREHQPQLVRIAAFVAQKPK